MMYDRIDDRSAQQAVRAKMEAAAQQDHGASVSGLMRGATASSAAPLMDQEYQRLCEAISGLDTAVIDLLERISPVLQPGLHVEANSVLSPQGNAPEADPSELRQRLMKARQWVESISAKIAPVKFRIEI